MKITLFVSLLLVATAYGRIFGLGPVCTPEMLANCTQTEEICAQRNATYSRHRRTCCMACVYPDRGEGESCGRLETDVFEDCARELCCRQGTCQVRTTREPLPTPTPTGTPTATPTATPTDSSTSL